MRWLFTFLLIILAGGVWVWMNARLHYPSALVGTWSTRSRQGTVWHYSEMTLQVHGDGIGRDYVTNEADFRKRHPGFRPSTYPMSWYVHDGYLIVDGDVASRYRLTNGGKTLTLPEFGISYLRQ